MNYVSHKFKPKQVLTSKELNEMDDQLANALTYTQQTLNDGQKAQVLENIGLTFTETSAGVIVIGGVINA